MNYNELNQLDPAVNDLGRFFNQLILALRVLKPLTHFELTTLFFT